MSEKRFIVFPNNVVWDNQLNEVVCRCILEGIGDAENVCQRLNELQDTISALKGIFEDIITYSKWDSEKPYCSLGIAVDKKTYYMIREILNE